MKEFIKNRWYLILNGVTLGIMITIAITNDYKCELHQERINLLEKQVESLETDLFVKETIIGRYEMAIDELYEKVDSVDIMQSNKYE